MGKEVEKSYPRSCALNDRAITRLKSLARNIPNLVNGINGLQPPPNKSGGITAEQQAQEEKATQYQKGAVAYQYVKTTLERFRDELLPEHKVAILNAYEDLWHEAKWRMDTGKTKYKDAYKDISHENPVFAGFDLSGITICEDSPLLNHIQVEANLGNVSFYKLAMDSLGLVRCNMQGGKAEDFKVYESVFDQCDLRGVDWKEVIIATSQFNSCNMQGVDWSQASFIGVEIQGCDIRGASFPRTSKGFITFSGVCVCDNLTQGLPEKEKVNAAIPNENADFQNLDVEEVRQFWVDRHTSGTAIPEQITKILVEQKAITSFVLRNTRHRADDIMKNSSVNVL